MPMPVCVLYTKCHDPYSNLAAEEAMLLQCRDTATLFLWQNEHTVVIGSGQNAWRECEVSLLEKEGGRLARRTTGGGAVYHDLGNLNFSFIVPRSAYDVPRQLNVVLQALLSLGIDARASGRNDLTAQGKKFSGNAFRLLNHAALHHGTLLVNTDRSRVGRYLNVDPSKLQAKGVRSVASRVCNLSDLVPVTVEQTARAMIASFGALYGACRAEELDPHGLPGYGELLKKQLDWNWQLGRSPVGDWQGETRFDWGGVELILSIEGGIVAAARVYTDAMDETLAPRLESALTGARFQPGSLSERAAHLSPDLARWLANCRI